MASSIYVVELTINPGVQLEVDAAEYERLTELGLVASLDDVYVPADKVVVSNTLPASPPPAGTVLWFNPSIP